MKLMFPRPGDLFKSSAYEIRVGKVNMRTRSVDFIRNQGIERDVPIDTFRAYCRSIHVTYVTNENMYLT